MRTISAKKETVERKWLIVDVSGKTLGRAATQIATILRGKHKPDYTPHVDTGDFVIVLNAEKIAVTGHKMTDKHYYHHTGYPGGIKSVSLEEQLEKHPDRVITHAVQGMLPKTKLGRAMMKKLKVYAGEDHPHAAQLPETFELK